MSEQKTTLQLSAKEDPILDEETDESIEKSLSEQKSPPPKKPTRKRIVTRTPKKKPYRKVVLPPKIEGQKSPIRTKMLLKLVPVLADDSALAEACEGALYDWAKNKAHCDYPDSKFVNLYLSKGINLIRNLNPQGSIGNDYLQPKVLGKEIKPDLLVRMTDQELYPPKWQKIKEQQMKDISAQTVEKVLTTSIYKCMKCKEAKCTYYQQQTRSGDESMTTFITCLNCGNKWRD